MTPDDFKTLKSISMTDYNQFIDRQGMTLRKARNTVRDATIACGMAKYGLGPGDYPDELRNMRCSYIPEVRCLSDIESNIEVRKVRKTKKVKKDNRNSNVRRMRNEPRLNTEVREV